MFVCEAAEDLPAVVRVDDKRLRQVLLNLLGNAVKFTDSGHVTLRARASDVSERATARIRFEVADTGIGISSEQLTRIFRPFEQVTEMHRREGGAGLGLAISRELVRLMGGEIEVQSTPGSGSVFSFELDLPVVSAGAATFRTQQKARAQADELEHEARAMQVADEDLLIPPPDEMRVLHQLALTGNMRDIRDRAAYLEDLDPRYAPFAERLANLARRYQSKSILELIERHHVPYDTDARAPADVHQR
jgi:anti-sigma regulatory factor (Ser/Thr protein kinase)